MSSSTTNRPTIAAEASPKWGSSLEMTMNRLGSLPVHWSRYLRLTVIVSSPEIASSRSTTTGCLRPVSRASEITASGLPISGASPNSPPRLDSVGPATLLAADQGTEDAGDHSLAAAGRPDHQQDLLKIEATGDDVAEPLLKRGDRVGVVRPQLLEEGEPARRFPGLGVVVERDGGLVEEPRVVRRAVSACRRGAARWRRRRSRPRGRRRSIHVGCWTASGTKQTAAMASSRSAILCRFGAHGVSTISLAPNQRGYSPGARPPRRRDYRMEELVEDVRALIDASGAQRVHLVGYDFGSTVAWAFAVEMPERLASLVTMSVPHPAAFLKALATSRQAFASWYIYFFQLPRIPERVLLRRRGTETVLSKMLQSDKQMPEAANRDARAMAEPGVLTAMLNWYRAIPLSDVRGVRHKITVPTMYVWSDGDTALLEKGARDCGRYVSGEYRFEILHGTHWLLDEQPDAVADLLLDWLAAHPT